jgi:heptaprenyl diphosphate synthase
VIHLQDFQLKIAHVTEQLTKSLFHPYLRENIAAPVIDEDKVLLLVSLLDELGMKEIDIVHYSVTTMLLQIALDTHEHVQNSSPGEEPPNMKERQLTVLAGTYYSGLFYKKLAGTGDIELIANLASGVKEVNEHKISVYHKDSEAIDVLMNSVMLIESCLVGKVADSFGANAWKEFAANLLFVKRMNQEENKFLKTGTSVVFEALKKLAFPKHNPSAKISSEQQKYLLSICERYIDFSISIIESCIQKMPEMDKQMQQRLGEILGQHLSISKFTLEEG